MLARAGHPTARLTLPGTADGAGGPRDGDLLRQWIDAVGGRRRVAARAHDASRCVAFGIGLGGVLAYLAAREHDAIDDLALWAVPDRGRTLLREGKSLSKVIASDFPEDQGREPAAAGDLELIGYLMTAETQAALSALQLSALATPRLRPAPRAAAQPRRRSQSTSGCRPASSARALNVEVLRTSRLLRSDGQTRAVADAGGDNRPRAGVAGARAGRLRSPGRRCERRTPPRVRETPELEVAGGVVESPLSCRGSHGDVVRDCLPRPVGRSGAARVASGRLRGAAAHRAEPGLGRDGAALGGTGDPHGTARPRRDR